MKKLLFNSRINVSSIIKHSICQGNTLGQVYSKTTHTNNSTILFGSVLYPEENAIIPYKCER